MPRTGAHDAGPAHVDFRPRPIDELVKGNAPGATRPAHDQSKESTMKLPPIVAREEWQAALDALRAKEKQATRARDALAAERRRLPMVRMPATYAFDAPSGRASLVDLFEGRRQLLLYHFMFGPNQEVGCDGCSMVVDQIGHLAHLHARDTSFALVSRAPIAKIERYRTRRVGPSRGSPRSGAPSITTSASAPRARGRASTRTASPSG
jgi:hypothetical protein